MASERWRQIEQLYHHALEQDAASRTAFLARECGGDEALREEVESLLRAGEGAESYLEAPALEVAAKAHSDDEKSEMDASRMFQAAPPNQPVRLGRYQITAKLGAGGMGAVYRGIDPAIGRAVAVKTIPQNILGSAAEATELSVRLKREARAAGSLAHPNIVTVFDTGEEAGMTYIVMELIDGSTLDAILTAGTPLPTSRALTILAAAAAALDFAHSRGVVHRDVKPSNIMIQADGTVKLTDFGIARRVTAASVTLPGILGTPHYMSPEQLRGQEATARSDQYSLAVVAWIMLTGSKPFDDEQLMPLMSKILTQEPPGSGLNSATDRVLRRAMAKDPALRFDSCSAFVAALRDACVAKQAANLEGGPKKRQFDLAIGVAACVLVGTAVAWRVSRSPLQPVQQEQNASSVGPAPSASTAAETQPKAGTPEQQARGAQAAKSAAKVARVTKSSEAPAPASPEALSAIPSEQPRSRRIESVQPKEQPKPAEPRSSDGGDRPLPKRGDLPFPRGQEQMKAGNYTGAIQFFTEAIALHPDRPEPYTSRGSAKERLGQNEAAVQDFSEAIRLAPQKAAVAYSGRGVCLARLHRDGEALADFNRALEIEPNLATALSGRGSVYFRRRQYAQALRDYDAAIKANPRFAPAFQSRAAARQATGFTAGAAADLKRAEQLRSQEKE